MKVVILAGGKGTRISEESRLKPKPMIEIGGKPILWHIMKTYFYYGFNEFIICCGYKGQMIKEFFVNYYMHQSDSTFDLAREEMMVHESHVEPWKVTLVNTGLNTLTAGRILKVREYVDGDEFLLTYGDGVADVDINSVIDFHKHSGKVATITTTKPMGRFGAIKFNKTADKVEGFKEKAREDQAWVNAGFMVCSKKMFDYLGDGNEMLENGPMEALVADGEMAAYRHRGFWFPMDTLQDKYYLEDLWMTGKAPWKVWC